MKVTKQMLVAADLAMHTRITVGDGRFETLRLGLEAALIAGLELYAYVSAADNVVFIEDDAHRVEIERAIAEGRFVGLYRVRD